MSAKCLLPIMLHWICSCALLPGQVQEMEQVDDVDLAGTKLSSEGIRILTFRCKVKLQHGRPLGGAFYVVADSRTKTYWWAVLPDPGSPGLKRLSWPASFPGYYIEKTPSGFTVFHMSSGKLFIASSRGRFGSDNELATLVRRDFDATAGQHLPKRLRFYRSQFRFARCPPEKLFRHAAFGVY